MSGHNLLEATSRIITGTGIGCQKICHLDLSRRVRVSVGVRVRGSLHRRGVGARAKVGGRAALQPVCDAVIDRWGRLETDVARGWISAMTGGRSTARPTSSARWRGWGSATTGVPGRAGDQRMRRTLDPHPQGPVPLGPAARHRRPAPPGRRWVRRPVASDVLRNELVLPRPTASDRCGSGSARSSASSRSQAP
jgi:hypothetical protein